MLPASGVVCTLLFADGKLAGWYRGRDGSLSDPVLARRWELPTLRVCICRGDGGCSASNRPGSYLGESGDEGRIAGDERGEGILGERDGERLRDEAVFVRMFVPDIQCLLVQPIFPKVKEGVQCCT